MSSVPPVDQDLLILLVGGLIFLGILFSVSGRVSSR